jgi:hypothetical protein
VIALEVDTSNFNESVRKLSGMPDIIRKAVTGALSETVDDLHTRQTLEMKQVFNNPTPYVLRGLKKRYPGGKMGRGVGGAGTYFEFFPVGKSPEDIVKPHVFGGKRPLKRSERRLSGLGLLSSDKFTTMGREYPRNSSGDISGARYTQMLHQLGGLSDMARQSMPKNRQKNRGGTSYFYLVSKSGTPVIVERNGSSTRIILVIANPGQGYKKKYDYFGVGQKQVAYSLPLHFNRIIQRYLSRI